MDRMDGPKDTYTTSQRSVELLDRTGRHVGRSMGR